MNRTLLATLAACSIALPVLAQDNPWSALRGKVKEGNWEYRMQMQMEGMPAGMSMPEQVVNNCVTNESIDKGGLGSRDGKLPDGCTIKDMKVSGSTATYRMECVKDPKMTVDTTMTFGGDSMKMTQKMAMNQGGQIMNMTNTMTGRFTGPCAGKK